MSLENKKTQRGRKKKKKNMRSGCFITREVLEFHFSLLLLGAVNHKWHLLVSSLRFDGV